ncbi:ABC transporter ATP-binding protein [Candidatus Poriferisocius sp.]|uniref:ABC transporter ATP-binding protein n=1 Tax=Candidatus Poriferisocius sp. TaxID=3101276 RepID=UPI00137D1792|nr:ABC transporter ATP-binding protein [Acidimicrobiia bacterium]MYE72719.1 ABC transporter ATP-binding protein [Acidimicrobiia bacterium]MYJ63460.1 ABC transporter ATP-binding protein [Acidimicrobiia bacterium]
MSVVETAPSGASPADAVASLAVEDLHVAFGGNRVLIGVDLNFTPGFNGLIGPNGAGKTTVFNVVSGYVRSSEGAVQLHGEDVLHMSRTQRVKAGIGRTFQAPRLILDATVMENTLLGRHHLFRWGHFAELLLLPQQRREETEARQICMDMLDRFGLADVAHEEAGALSLGSQKLVEVARALVANPTVVLLDEPAAGLGADDVTVLLRGLREIQAERNLCVIIIEHDLQLVTSLCPKISVLHFGEIISEGSPEHVTSDPAVIEAYLGHGFEAEDGGEIHEVEGPLSEHHHIDHVEEESSLEEVWTDDDAPEQEESS